MDQELKVYLTEQFKNVATKDDLKNLVTKDEAKNFATKDDILGVRVYIDKTIAAAIADLGATINETIAIPLERLISELKDNPSIRRDVKHIKQILHLPD
jgi:hypothetical protein